MSLVRTKERFQYCCAQIRAVRCNAESQQSIPQWYGRSGGKWARGEMREFHTWAWRVYWACTPRSPMDVWKEQIAPRPLYTTFSLHINTMIVLALRIRQMLWEYDNNRTVVKCAVTNGTRMWSLFVFISVCLSVSLCVSFSSLGIGGIFGMNTWHKGSIHTPGREVCMGLWFHLSPQTDSDLKHELFIVGNFSLRFLQQRCLKVT